MAILRIQKKAKSSDVSARTVIADSQSTTKENCRETISFIEFDKSRLKSKNGIMTSTAITNTNTSAITVATQANTTTIIATNKNNNDINRNCEPRRFQVIPFDKNRSALNDKYARMVEPVQDQEDFLWMGKHPQIGQRAEIRLGFTAAVPTTVATTTTTATTTNSTTNTTTSAVDRSNPGIHECRLVGIVTKVGPLITPNVFDGMASRQILQRTQDIPGMKPITPDHLCPEISTKLLHGLIERNGTVHGQRLIVYAVLCPSYWNHEDSLPVSKDRIYRLTLMANECRICYWAVHQVIDVTDLSATKIPKLFVHWLQKHASWLVDDSDDEYDHDDYDKDFDHVDHNQNNKKDQEHMTSTSRVSFYTAMTIPEGDESDELSL